jgi:hypothetical protein
MSSATPTKLSSAPPEKRRVWRWLLVLMFGGLAWTGYVAFSEPANLSVTLPDGVRVTYVASSRGMALPKSPGSSGWEITNYQHSVPQQEASSVQRWWHAVRRELPVFIAHRLPAWEAWRDDYPNWPDQQPLELQFRVFGSLLSRQWDIGIADENGWETRVREYTWGDDGRDARGASQISGWVRLGSAYPRHCKTLRIRFHPSEQIERRMNPLLRRNTFTEMVLPNPFFEGDATNLAKGESLPITKPFRCGTITLENLTRDSMVGDDYGSLDVTFSLQHHNGKPLEDYDVRDLVVTDSSGQYFRKTLGSSQRHEGGRYTASSDTAPWSDDPCWTVRLRLNRRNFTKDADPNEVFLFEKLPVPSGKSTELNREITRNGITLRLGTITTMTNGESRFNISGWTAVDPRSRVIVIHDARDDQGRTRTTIGTGRHDVPLIGGPVSGGTEGPGYSLRLPPGAKSWDLAVIPETVTEVEFKVLPPKVAK